MSQHRAYNLRKNPRKRGVPIDDWKKALDAISAIKTTYIPPEATRQTIRQRASDTECEVLTPNIVSLKCPISQKRIRVAARGVNCSHMQCFDLANYLRARGCQGRWYCAICQSPTKLDALRIDTFFQEMLKSVADEKDVDKMELLSDGSYIPYKPEEVDADVCIDDVSAEKPEPPEYKPTEEQLLTIQQMVHEVRYGATTRPPDSPDETTSEDVKPVIAQQGTDKTHVAGNLSVEQDEVSSTGSCALERPHYAPAADGCRPTTRPPDGPDETASEDIEPVIVLQGTDETHFAGDLDVEQNEVSRTGSYARERPPYAPAAESCRPTTRLPEGPAENPSEDIEPVIVPQRTDATNLDVEQNEVSRTGSNALERPSYAPTAECARFDKEHSPEFGSFAHRFVGPEEENESSSELRLKAEIKVLAAQLKDAEDRNKSLVAERDTARAQVQRLEAILARSTIPGGRGTHLADPAEVGRRPYTPAAECARQAS